MSALKKAAIRKSFYATRHATKKLYLEHVEKIRAKREKNKNYSSVVSHKFLEKKEAIMEERKNTIKKIIRYAVGQPSFYNFNIQFKDTHKITVEYGGWEYSRNYSKSYGHPSHTHNFSASLPIFYKKWHLEKVDVDDIYNIFCKKIKKIAAIAIYKASFIKKRRGYSFDIINGFIAIIHSDTQDELSYHAETKREAIAGLRRKIKAQKAKNFVKKGDLITTSRFIKLTGACKIGCENFKQKHKIEKKAFEVTALLRLLIDKNQHTYANIIKNKLQ